MPSQIPSSFAAAAGQGPNRDLRNGGKNDGRGSGDWYVYPPSVVFSCATNNTKTVSQKHRTYGYSA